MPLFHLAILALIQGITEFLPISSSAHLILVPEFLDVPDQGLLIDVAVHVGTLFAVMLYFWRDLWGILTDFIAMSREGKKGPGIALTFHLIIATIPVVIAGYFIHTYLAQDFFRSMEIIAWTTIGFGILLWFADHYGLKVRRLEHLGFLDSLLIGLSQALALIPGTSRSGVTMTMARFLGFERGESARFSLLLSIPTIIAAGTLSGIDLYKAGDVTLTKDALIAAGLAFISALFAISLMMAWLKRAGFTPFVFYRLILGGGLLYILYF